MNQKDRTLVDIAHRAIVAVGPNDEETWSTRYGLLGVAYAIVRNGHAPMNDLLSHMVKTARVILHRQWFCLDEQMDADIIDILQQVVSRMDPRNETFQP